MENQFIRYFSGLGISANKVTSDNHIRETVLNGFFTFDKSWTVKYCNRVAENLVGEISGGISGKNLWKVFGSVIPPEFYELVRRSFLNESPDHFEEYPGVMGSWFDVVFYHCDNLVSVSFKSIHQPAQADDLQEQLIRLNSLYRTVTEITSDGLWEWDLDTKEIFWVDGGHKRLFGYQIENALIPQSFWEDRIHPDDRKRVVQSLSAINRQDPSAIWEQEYRFRKADGKYAHVKDRGKVFHDKDVEAVRMTGTTQDISAFKSLEQQLSIEKRKKRKAVSTDGFEAQERERVDMADNIYNNLSQTLCAAKLYIEYAKTDEEKKAECLEISSKYILDVIQDLRSVYKKLRLAGMYYGLFESIRILINKQNQLFPGLFELNVNGMEEEDLEDNLQLDMYRMTQELVANIVEHAGATRAWVDISRYKNEVTLLVSDNGQGCDLSKAAMGAGIIQVMSCADLYESRVYTISMPGEGYTFRVVLPLSGRRKIPQQVPSDYDD